LTEKFCRLLDEAVKDEEKAQDFYMSLKREIVEEYSGELRSVLNAVVDEVANAESGHGRLFENLRRVLCERGRS